MHSSVKLCLVIELLLLLLCIPLKKKLKFYIRNLWKNIL
nr:ALTOb [JC polyomavirus]UYL83842.1 ALTOb [JC polyomavirus]